MFITAPCQRVMLACIIYFISALLSLSFAQEKNPYHSFIVLADIHFNPFESCDQQALSSCAMIELLMQKPIKEWEKLLVASEYPIAKTGKNTNLILLNNMLNQAQLVAKTEKIRFVLVLGDVLAHHFKKTYYRYGHKPSEKKYRIFVRKTLLFLNQKIANTFPAIGIYQAVGNNDSYQHDYTLTPKGSFFQDLSLSWPKLIQLNNKNQDQINIQTSLGEGGYYAHTLSNQANLRLILLNSVLFSNKAKGNKIEEAAKKQLKWLQQELIQAKLEHQKVLIAMHIPAFVDINVGGRHILTLMNFWKTSYKNQFQQLLQTFSPTILAILSAHLHTSWTSKWIINENKTLPILGVPAISPIFGTTPAFSFYRYEPHSAQLIDYSTYYLSGKERRQKI